MLRFPQQQNKTVFDSSLPSFGCKSAHVIFLLFMSVMFVYSGIQHLLKIFVTWRVSYRRQGLLTIREYLGSPSDFHAAPLLIVLVFFVVLCVFCFVLFLLLLLFFFFFFGGGLRHVPSLNNVSSVSGLFILDCAFGFL